VDQDRGGHNNAKRTDECNRISGKVVQIMDKMTPTEAFVNQFCNHTAIIFRSFGRMRSFYLFGDPRPGTPEERLDRDSKFFAEWEALRKV
jgi:hypothetical protein